MGNWLRTKRVKLYGDIVSKKTVIIVFSFVEFKRGRNWGNGVNPKLAVLFATWLSVEFEMLVADWIEEWMITGQKTRRWTVPRPTSRFILKPVHKAQLSKTQHQKRRLDEAQRQRQSLTTPQTSLPVTMPTQEEMEYLKSRPWEKAELEGKPVDWADVAEKSGYGRAMRVVWDWNKQKRLKQDYRA